MTLSENNLEYFLRQTDLPSYSWITSEKMIGNIRKSLINLYLILGMLFRMMVMTGMDPSQIFMIYTFGTKKKINFILTDITSKNGMLRVLNPFLH